MARSFERTAIRVPGAPNMSGYMIRCHKCGAREKVTANGHTGSMPPEGIAAKFRNKGWIVGHRESGDICPACQPKKHKPPPSKSMQVVIWDEETNKPCGVATVKEPIKAEPPRDMSKEDRRLIFAKVNDVYLDETQGYSTGWSDKRVAEDLGVPQAWVKSIREDNFGIEGANEDFRPLVEEVRKLLAEMEVVEKIISERMAEAQKTKDELLSRANHINGRIAKLEKTFS